MPSQGPNNPTSGTNSGSGSAWTNPGGITTGTAASNTVSAGSPTQYLVGTGLGFSIPAGATIDGILVEWDKRNSTGFAGGVADNAVRIVKGGTVGATDRSDGTAWPTVFTWFSYGGSSDLWGETWTSTDINASNFGAAFSATGTAGGRNVEIDNLRITVYYTTSPPPPSAVTLDEDGLLYQTRTLW